MTDRPCNGGYERMHLGHEFLSDLLIVRFPLSLTHNPPPLFAMRHLSNGEEISSVATDENPVTAQTGIGFWRSLTSTLLAGSARTIDVPRQELDGLFRPNMSKDGSGEIVIYDNVPGGAGYGRKIGERFSEVLKITYEIVSTCTCDTSCYDCLRTYSN